MQRVIDATRERDTSRLLKTPLQVAIMQLLLERMQRAPHGRYQLFDAYFTAIYAREQNKAGWIGRLLEEHRSDIVAVHERIALQLQVEAESHGDREASVPMSVLADITRSRLKEEGHEDDAASKLADTLVKAATQRLVLLVPVLSNDVGFEVRSLREFMAARALTIGPDDNVQARLATLAPSAHWRNTWLFAAGRLFIDREHLRSTIVGLLRVADNNTLLAMLAAPGAELATDLLEDDVALGSPQYRRLLAEHAMDRVAALPDGTWRALGATLFDAAEDDPLIRARLDKHVDHSLSAGGGAAATAQRLIETWSEHTGALAARARALRGGSAKPPREGDYGLLLAPTGQDTVAGPATSRYLKQFVPQSADASQLTPLMNLLDRLDLRLVTRRDEGGAHEHPVYVTQRDLPDMAVLDPVLSRTDLADAYAGLVDAIPAASYQAASALKDVARYWFTRRPVSDLL